MNKKSIIIAAVALIMGLSACNKEEGLTQDGAPVNAVRITATVGNPFAATRSNPVGTVEEQGRFNEGDRILVRIPFSANEAIYQFNGTHWMPINNNYLLWDSNVGSFDASFPLKENGAKMNIVQQDQSTLPQLALSDLMSAKIEDAPKGEPINFVMQRNTIRLIVKIAGFNPEFSSESVVSDVKIMIGLQGYPDEYGAYIPYTQGEEADIGKVGTTYTLLAGGEGDTEDRYVSLKVGEKDMRTAHLPFMERGKSYTYNITVGKEKLEIESVTVEDWSNTDTITGGQAGERG